MSPSAALSMNSSLLRPLAPLRGANVSACKCKNVHWPCLCSAVEMCVGVCIVGVHTRVLARSSRARVGVCVCAAQALPNEPTHAGNGPPVPELHNHRTCASRARAPAMACFVHAFLNVSVYRATAVCTTVRLMLVVVQATAIPQLQATTHSTLT